VAEVWWGRAGGFAGFLATSLGGQRPFGIEGWRVVFLIVAAVSAVVGCIVVLLAADPRRRVRTHGLRHATCLACLVTERRTAALLLTFSHVTCFPSL